MTRAEFSLNEIANFIQSLKEYRDLAAYLPQLSKDDSLKSFCNEENVKWWQSGKLKDWDKINVHLVFQNWPNTSCGWGGIGGSSMSDKLNVVIENKWHGAYYVYWDGKLAYIIKNDPGIKLDNLPYIYAVPKDILIYSKKLQPTTNNEKERSN